MNARVTIIYHTTWYVFMYTGDVMSALVMVNRYIGSTKHPMAIHTRCSRTLVAIAPQNAASTAAMRLNNVTVLAPMCHWY